MNYDIIGDIHGHAEALKALLASMKYQERNGVWGHPERQAIFVGDFIDRGPRQISTVDIVQRMVKEGKAQAIMGNHEFNAIAWFLPDPESQGEYLRKHHSGTHGDKNYSQHEAFLNEVIGTPRHKEIIDWFLTLPLWLDLGEFRVVHACWHPRFMKFLAPQPSVGYRLTAETMVEASREPKDQAEKDNPHPSVFKAVEALTKGLEIQLPGGKTFKDKDGHSRDRVRVCWWDANATTYRQAALLETDVRESLPDDEIPKHVRLGHDGGSPIFFGHYWLTGKPKLLTDCFACVDYSIAKGGKLVAYQWQHGSALDANAFCWVGK
jgi:hypothetical protein